MAVTIKDVAKHANVSIATVSRVINDAENVSGEIRGRVVHSVEELGFRPNRMAQSLKLKTTNTIGVIITDLKNPFFMQVINELEKEVTAGGYSMLITGVGDSKKQERDAITLMAEKRVDGIVIASSGNNEDYLSELRDTGIPVIIIDRKTFSYRFDSVYIDKMNSMIKIIEHLFSKGHKRIALATGAKNLSTNFDRYLGYVRSHYNADIPVDESLVYYGSFSEEFGRKVLNQILAEKDPATVIISGSALITEGILKEAAQKNIRIPEDISIVSFGNIQMAEIIKPRLTYAKSKEIEIGAIAARIILDKMRKQSTDIVEHVLDTEIVEGESVKDIS